MDATKPIFVFGSNLAGRHGRGAAAIAKLQYGAIYGKGKGLQGRSYGIPTKDEKLRILPLRVISGYVGEFLRFATKHPEIVFKVTAIGTGLAGYSHDDIGPMFSNAPLNCILPVTWKNYVMDADHRKWWIS